MDYNAATVPAKLALEIEDKTLTWQELALEVDDFAGKLATLTGPKAKTQQVIGLLMPNSWEYVVVYLAILKLGHIAMPIDTSYKQLEIDAIVKQIKPRLVIALHKSSLKNCYDYQNVLALPEPANYRPLRLPANKQIASLLFTSGTTGRPKAVPNTHANHIWTIETCSSVWNWASKDTILVSLRLSHWYGLVMGLSGSIYHGNTMYLQDWFDPLATLTALSSGKISLFTHVPFAYQEMLIFAEKNPSKKYNLSKIRLMISGSGPLPPDNWRQFKDKFGVEVVEAYGSSEAGRIAANSLDNPKPGSPGQLLPGVRAKLSTDHELLIKSAGVFPGYYHNSTATRAGFTDDGWWRTGDIATLDGKQVFLKGRLQEKIRKFGYTISPRDVEWALLKHPKIQEVYVMGHPDERNLNDTLVYFIVGNITDEELNEYSKSNLLFAWRADKVIRLESLPRTATGKPSILKLKELITV